MYGAAGIGSVLLRYQQLAGIDAFDATLEEIYVATDCKYAVGFGKVMGLAGITGFRLDAYHYTSQERHIAAVAKLLKGIEMFRASSMLHSGEIQQNQTRIADTVTLLSAAATPPDALYLSRKLPGNFDTNLRSGFILSNDKRTFLDVSLV
ncbi:hypothetical protein BGZ97_006447 [Linnemannia gamsii]|uniref:Uncharacterized protein n=1 Tax=Linnemannia gamsii TaxID=64522 RepID=A0A9P6QRL5_9FUNG|nr:hypothetical protein BGZ97_006447 [Linnemannia gamsii]